MRGEIRCGGHHDRLKRFDAPRNRLSRDRPKVAGSKRKWVIGILLGEPHHFTHFDNDLGERQSPLLLRRYLRPY